ncbi:Bacterial extracellular solute-binding proteins, family 5 Middle [uncultured archaeon]|nr:Bacterial extracellular solute-binding proteins, family 5 Middle [uncultured archaeon]
MKHRLGRLMAGFILFMLILAIQGQCAGEVSGTVLKIGSPSVVKSASLLGDSSLGVFSHLSNPTLMKMAENGSIVGLTADRAEVSKDGMIWKFFIRDNFYWSDGEKLTPDDVMFTFNYLADKSPSAGWIKKTVENISVDGNAVVFKLNKPYSRLNLEFATYTILPRHIWEKIDKPLEYVNNGEVVGFGPYYISKIDTDAGVIYFKKNPYWKGSSPYFDSIEIHTFSNMDVLSMALEKGEVDAFYKYAGSYPYTSIQKLKDTGNFDFIEKDNIGLTFLAMNLKKEPMSDLEFRKALSYALNYSEILNLDALGYGQVPNAGFVPPSMMDFKETRKLQYNLSKARELLSEAGYKDSNGDGILDGKDGKAIKLTFLTRTDYQRPTELVIGYLKDLGINAEIKSVDSSTWIKQKDAYEYDMTITRSTPWGMLMHANWGTGYFDSTRTGEGVLHNVDDPAFLKLCDGILAATSQSELKEYAYQVQDYYAANLPGIALYWSRIVTPYNKVFTGWYSDPLYGIYNVDSFLEVRKA